MYTYIINNISDNKVKEKNATINSISNSGIVKNEDIRMITENYFS